MPSLVHIFAGGKRKLADSATFSSAPTGISTNFSPPPPVLGQPGSNDLLLVLGARPPHNTRGFLGFVDLGADVPHGVPNSNIIGYIPYQHHQPYQYHQHHRAITTVHPPYYRNYYYAPPPRATTTHPMIDTHNWYPQEERRNLPPSDKYSNEIDHSNYTSNSTYNTFRVSSRLNKEDHASTIQGIDAADKRSNDVSYPSTHLRKKIRANKDGSIRSKKVSFDERCNQLLQFREEFGHCRVQRNDKDNQSLGIWCKNMRAAYSKRINGKESIHKITPYRIERLENLGFEWTASTSSSKRAFIY